MYAFYEHGVVDHNGIIRNHNNANPIYQSLQSIENHLIASYCPYLDVNGIVRCPIFNITTIASSLPYGPPRRNMGAGLGYDVTSHSVRFAIFEPAPVTPILPLPRYEEHVFRFENASDFLRYLFVNASDRVSERMGGIFAQGNPEFTAEFVRIFGDHTQHIYVIHKEYHTHRSALINDTMIFTSEFRDMLHLLPVPFHPQNLTHWIVYRKFFELFGTGFLSEAVHGAIISRVVAVKTCYQEKGNITQELLDELHHDMIHNTNKQQQPTCSHCPYRRIVRNLDIDGGNFMVSLQDRMKTFVQFPALVQFRYHSLLDIVPESHRRAIVDALEWYGHIHLDGYGLPHFYLYDGWLYEVQLERDKLHRMDRHVRVIYARCHGTSSSCATQDDRTTSFCDDAATLHGVITHPGNKTEWQLHDPDEILFLLDRTIQLKMGDNVTVLYFDKRRNHSLTIRRGHVHADDFVLSWNGYDHVIHDRIALVQGEQNNDGAFERVLVATDCDPILPEGGICKLTTLPRTCHCLGYE